MASVKQVKYLSHITLQFYSQQDLAGIQLSIQADAGLMIQVSPVRVQDGSTQAVVMALHDKPCDSPSLLVDFAGRQLAVRLPLFVNRFIEAVEMPESAFQNNWDAITHK